MAASPERPVFPFDGDEEPLFADDLEDYDDDEIGALPPPMPSLADLSAQQDRGSNQQQRMTGDQTSIPGFDFSDGANQSGNPATNDQGPPLKKRKPILTLKIDRIFSEKGLNYIHTEFPKLKFKGKGHEAADLKHLMKHYEHWANMLYPKMTFGDVTDRIEALAKKREFKTNLIRMRRRQARGGAVTPPLSDNEGSADPPAVPPASTKPTDHSQPPTDTLSQRHSSTPPPSHSPTPPPRHSPTPPPRHSPTPPPSHSSTPPPNDSPSQSHSPASPPPPSFTEDTSANSQSLANDREDLEGSSISDNLECI